MDFTIAATKYDKGEVFFVGYCGVVTDAAIEHQLLLNGHEGLEIIERRAAEAPDTNTDEDLLQLNELQQEYDQVDFVRVRRTR